MLFTLPTEPSAFARVHLGIPTLGTYDAHSLQYEQTVTPAYSHSNLVPTVHGGWLAGWLDEACAMLVFFTFGVNSAFTLQQCIEYKSFERSGIPLRVLASFVHRRGNKLFVRADVHADEKLIATAATTWGLRKAVLKGEKPAFSVGTELLINSKRYRITKIHWPVTQEYVPTTVLQVLQWCYEVVELPASGKEIRQPVYFTDTAIALGVAALQKETATA